MLPHAVNALSVVVTSSRSVGGAGGAPLRGGLPPTTSRTNLAKGGMDGRHNLRVPSRQTVMGSDGAGGAAASQTRQRRRQRRGQRLVFPRGHLGQRPRAWAPSRPIHRQPLG